MPDIYYVLNNRFPTIKAHSLQVAKTCEGFSICGAHVTLIIPIRKRPVEITGISPFTLYNIKEPFKIARLPSLDFSWFRLNGKFFFVVQQVLFALTTLVYLTGKKGPIYSRDPFTLYILSYFKKNIFWEVHRLPENIHSMLYTRILKKISGIIVITKKLKERFEDTGFPPDKILVAPDGIDFEEFQIQETKEEARKKLNLPLNKIIVMYVGHLFDWKGADIFIDASRHLDDSFLTLIVGGIKKDVERLEEKIKASAVRFEGFKPHTLIPLYMRAADILILPNKKDGNVSEFYTSPLKLFEYMASSRPIIASDLPSLREVLNDKNSVLIKPDDAILLAEAIRNLAPDGSRAHTMTAQALQDVREFTWTNRAQSVINYIHRKIHG